MTNILLEIIEIKMQMIKIFHYQIECIKKEELEKAKNLQDMENRLSIILQKKQKVVKRNKSIISLCENYELIERLKDTCINFDKIFQLKKNLILEKSKAT